MSRAAAPLVLALAGTLAAWSAPARPDAASSDRVHVLDADGRSHVLQHTVATDGARLALELPGSVVPQRVLFIGAERERWAALHAERPERVTIGSGGALVRYRHQYGDEVVDAGDGRFTLVARSVPESLEIEPGPSGAVPEFEAVTAWVFPADASVDAWRAGDGTGSGPGEGAGGTDGAGPGTWSFEDNVLTWSQRGLAAVTLEIEYRLPARAGARSTASGGTTPSPAPVPDSPATDDVARSGTEGGTEAADTDGDGVPDARDVCLREPARRPAQGPRSEPADGTDGPDDADAAAVAFLGCRRTDGRLVLRSIGFPTGRTRLDLPARRTLDRLAAALAAGDVDWEIAAHTDGEGPASRNLALSVRRAESVRHYLMLRGAEPNRLVARGYGETDPIADDATAAGRAANRRVELRPAVPGDGDATSGAGENPPDGDG